MLLFCTPCAALIHTLRQYVDRLTFLHPVTSVASKKCMHSVDMLQCAQASSLLAVQEWLLDCHCCYSCCNRKRCYLHSTNGKLQFFGLHSECCCRTYCRLQPSATKASIAYQTCGPAIQYSSVQGTSAFQAIATDQAGNQASFNATISVLAERSHAGSRRHACSAYLLDMILLMTLVL